MKPLRTFSRVFLLSQGYKEVSSPMVKLRQVKGGIQMARPTTKEGLLQVATEQYEKLCQLIEKMSEAEQEADFAFSEAFLAKRKEKHWRRDQNLRDVLIHLYEWHRLLLDFVENNQQEPKAPFLPAPYNWRNYGELNQAFTQKHQQTSLAEAKNLLANSHERCAALVDSFNEEQLFTKKYYSWTGSSNLASYCISATGSHYDWAIKKIKARQK